MRWSTPEPGGPYSLKSRRGRGEYQPPGEGVEHPYSPPKTPDDDFILYLNLIDFMGENYTQIQLIWLHLLR